MLLAYSSSFQCRAAIIEADAGNGGDCEEGESNEEKDYCDKGNEDK